MNKLRASVLCLVVLLLSACSVKIVPMPTATATVNPADNSISEEHNNVQVTVRLEELSVSPYMLVDNIASFYLEIHNRSSEPVDIPHEAFLLVDNASRQYRTITPERVREIVSKDTVYLIPYPYVGYYYLEDQMTVAQTDTFSSSLPFYAEYHPQDIFTQALPEGSVLPGSKVAGLLYFLTDLERVNQFEVRLYPTVDMTESPLYRFPFAVEK
ncbi:MAG: hypothetical protein JRF07_01795 [Deltaproteobacteria bacterium]|nr:hypothetical protein [Deltaproteobacteria bacterium]